MNMNTRWELSIQAKFWSELFTHALHILEVQISIEIRLIFRPTPERKITKGEEQLSYQEIWGAFEVS